MGEKEDFARVAPAKDSFYGSCWQNIDSVRLASVLLKVQRRTKGQYGDSGFARMTTPGLRQNDEQEQATAKCGGASTPLRSGRDDGCFTVLRQNDGACGSCWQNIDSVRLIQLRKSGASGRRESISARSKLPLDGFDPYINCIKRGITTMPTIFRREVV
jgi:hypothetical protein